MIISPHISFFNPWFFFIFDRCNSLEQTLPTRNTSVFISFMNYTLCPTNTMVRNTVVLYHWFNIIQKHVSEINVTLMAVSTSQRVVRVQSFGMKKKKDNTLTLLGAAGKRSSWNKWCRSGYFWNESYWTICKIDSTCFEGPGLRRAQGWKNQGDVLCCQKFWQWTHERSFTAHSALWLCNDYLLTLLWANI